MKEKNIPKMLQYIVLTYLISWISWGIIIVANQFGYLKYDTLPFMIPLTIGTCGPPIAIIILMVKWGRIKGIKDVYIYLFKTDHVALTIIVTAVVCMIMWACVHLSFQRSEMKWYYFILLIPADMFGGGFEELGWRGFLQPELEKKISSQIVPLILGAIWACWHIPLWFINGTTQYVSNFSAFCCMCILWSCVFAMLRKVTENVFAIVWLHAWIDVLFDMYLFNYSFSSVMFWITTVVQAAAAYTIYLYVSRKDKIG